MSADILQRGARGGGVTILSQVGKIAIQFGSVIILSRLLSPDDFGLIAMVTVFVSFGELIRDFGLPTAALQAKTLSRGQASNLFWANSALGAVTGAVLLAATPLIVLFYDQAALAAIVPVMALVLLLNGLQAQVQVQLARDLRFGVLAWTDLGTQIAALAVAVVIAATGGGYWALVWQAVANAAFLLVLRGVISRWVPTMPHRGQGTRPLLRSATHLGLSQFLVFAASNADTVSIGARWDATSLGFYNRAFQLLTVPVSKTLAPLTRVAVPGIRRASEEGHDRHRLLLRVQSAMGTGIIGVFAVAAGSASVAIPFVLGEEWQPTVLIFQLLAVGGCFQVFSYASYWAFLLAGQSGELLKYNLVTKPITIALVVGASFISVPAVAAAYAAGLAIAWPINLLWLKKTAGQPLAPFLWNGIRSLTAGGIAGAVGVALNTWLRLDSLLQLAVSVLAIVLVYALALCATPSGRREAAQFGRMTASLVLRRR